MLRPLYLSLYILRRAFRGMIQSLWLQILGIGTITGCMLLLAMTMLIVNNVKSAAQGWGIDVPITVYLVQDTPKEVGNDLRKRLASMAYVERAEAVPAEIAFRRLQIGLGEKSGFLDGLGSDAFPESIEVYLSAQTPPTYGASLANQLSSHSEIEDIALASPWIRQAQEFLDTLTRIALAVGIVVSLICITVIWNTIRIGVFARRAEIEILRLVGGTTSYVRAPFVVEGFIQGFVGMGLALAVLWGLFLAAEPHLLRGMALMFAAGGLHFFSTTEIAIGLGFGGLLGVAGSRTAVARYVQI